MERAFPTSETTLSLSLFARLLLLLRRVKTGWTLSLSHFGFPREVESVPFEFRRSCLRNQGEEVDVGTGEKGMLMGTLSRARFRRVPTAMRPVLSIRAAPIMV